VFFFDCVEHSHVRTTSSISYSAANLNYLNDKKNNFIKI
jgi:hypothetical protein